jgi:hypothetical protein
VLGIPRRMLRRARIDSISIDRLARGLAFLHGAERGLYWMNVNYLLVENLMKSGNAGLASVLRHHTLDLIACRDDCYEFYSPEIGANLPAVALTFGWLSALFISMAIQENQRIAEA